MKKNKGNRNIPKKRSAVAIWPCALWVNVCDSATPIHFLFPDSFKRHEPRRPLSLLFLAASFDDMNLVESHARLRPTSYDQGALGISF